MARKDGYVTPNLTIKGKKKEIINECLEPQPFYDDWAEHRDGMRDWRSDRTKIKKLPNWKLKEKINWWNRNSKEYTTEETNKKNKKLLKVRKAKKQV